MSMDRTVLLDLKIKSNQRKVLTKLFSLLNVVISYAITAAKGVILSLSLKYNNTETCTGASVVK